MHSKSIPEALELTDSSLDGLSSLEGAERLKNGLNQLIDPPPTSLFILILGQFNDQLVLILVFAALVSLVLAVVDGDDGSSYVESIVIVLILIANATVGVYQESKAEFEIKNLMNFTADLTRVRRDGHVVTLDTKLLVVGDVVVLKMGDKVPADCLILSITSSLLSVDQSILTGESSSVSKSLGTVDKDSVIQEQTNIVFSGTTVTAGSFSALVVKTGQATQIGLIHVELHTMSETKSPLKTQLDDFGTQLSKLITIVCFLVFIVNINHFGDSSHGSYYKGMIYYFKIAISLAVAAIPEGLSVIITTCLALGTKKMAKRGAIVRKLESVETLGCTSVICSDKTGTLTANLMAVRKVLVDGLEIKLDGNDYGDKCRITNAASEAIMEKGVGLEGLDDLLDVAYYCNEASIVHEGGEFLRVGEPTEAALISLVDKVRGKVVDKYTRLNILEFERARKRMSVIVSSLSGSGGRETRSAVKKLRLMCKGAVESVLEKCTHCKSKGVIVKMGQKEKDEVLKRAEEWGEESLRVLGFAYKLDPVIPTQPVQSDFDKYESDMVFAGLVGMKDPPRSEVVDALVKCKQAGIRVLVITGDNKKTAESVCRQIGLFTAHEALQEKSFTGKEFDQSKDKLQCVRQASLFSRTEPRHKQEIVELLKKDGEIVAMTGDGVNDATALKMADIGIAMGSGTDVAKLASDMILADDNFATIIEAVKEGRSIYCNTKQFIRYLVSSNIGEVVSIFLTVLLGMPEALIPVQLLWVNLVTDGLPATALGFNPSDDDVMTQPPRDAKEGIVTGWLFFRYLLVGLYVGTSTVFGYAWFFLYASSGPHITYYQLSHFHSCSIEFAHIGCEMFYNEMAHKATTMSLSILVVVEMFNALNRYFGNLTIVFQRTNLSLHLDLRVIHTCYSLSYFRCYCI